MLDQLVQRYFVAISRKQACKLPPCHQKLAFQCSVIQVVNLCIGFRLTQLFIPIRGDPHLERAPGRKTSVMTVADVIPFQMAAEEFPYAGPPSFPV